MRTENSPSSSIGGVVDSETDTAKISQRLANFQSEQHVELSEGFIIEDVMRRLQAILDQKPKETRWRRFMTHPLFLLFAGVVLSGLMGGWITYVYSVKQNELAAERSFADELNKQRIQKLSDVWERLDEDEGAIDRLLNQPDDPQNPDDKNQRAKQIEKLIQEDRRTVDKNRFWLGESHSKIHEYLDASSLYAIQKLVGAEDKLDALLQHRKAAKSDLEAERDKSLKSMAERAKGTNLYLF